MLDPDNRERAKVLGIDPKTLYMLEQFETSIARDPNDAHAYANMGVWWRWKSVYGKALELLNTAIRLDAKFAYALRARADLRATCPDAEFRDGALAIDDATTAIRIAKKCEMLNRDWEHRTYLQVLAAAYAEAGNFEAAIKAENEALEFTITKSATEEIKAHLTWYGSRKPLRDNKGIVRHGPGRQRDS